MTSHHEAQGAGDCLGSERHAELDGDLRAATRRLLQAADVLPDADWEAPSVCAGWSRAHVLAHLALNAEGLTGVLRGLTTGVPTTTYASVEARDRDIVDLAAAAPDVVRRRLHDSAAELDAALVAAGEVPADATFERTPGGPVLRAGVIPGMRLREVEIHHADLLVGYSPADWPARTAERFLRRDARVHASAGLRVEATDTGGTWEFGQVGPEAPVVRGPVTALAWWASGRDPGWTVTCSTGVLPTLPG
ncbi:maleylpyruvate isomerase family mycothiol-dependent enzyme [Nocardioides sp. zg-ZUI104]|uniref:maleylpyruvate isomerase family mycothiol-dependent enzyme n=1 Tax=Nocardioides faecalis TaxID=2803858 RepID=UPI001BCC9BA2|nr:maleylpyruvate isomerase family mycothiol-dependent enzyme [Nocardioides faecalis]MBS4753961.1 maleylpyruvate isomerase family mycothiol-dependent enzyme [Nocardioides faecalis]